MLICCFPIHGNNMSSRYCSWLCLAYLCKNVGSVYPCSVMCLDCIPNVCHMFRYIKYVYSDIGVDFIHMYAQMHTYLHTYVHSYAYIHTFMHICMQAQLHTLHHVWLHTYMETPA